MAGTTPDLLARLAAANPAPIRQDHGREPAAQAGLQRILIDTGAGQDPSPSHARLRSPRGLALILVATLLSAGGLLAAADPMGWWSTSPNQAQYQSTTTVHVDTPAAQQIRCQKPASGGYSCTAQHTACEPASADCKNVGDMFAYDKFATITPPAKTFSRAGLLAYIAQKRAQGTMTAAAATHFRTDLAHVPDSFFVEFRLASSYGTFGSSSTNKKGQTIAPPPGVPSILVCEPAGQTLSCQNLNGDRNTPIGAGVYGAVPGPGWRVVPHSQHTAAGLPPGIHFTAAEDRVLIDMVRYGTVTQSGNQHGQAPTS